MNSLASIILAIVMAFSSVGGMFAGSEEAVSFEAKIGVNAEALMQMAGSAGGALTGITGTAAGAGTAESAEAAEEAQQTFKVVGDIMNALTLKGVAAKDTTELEILAGEDIALSIGVKNTEEGALLASSLLGDNVVSVAAQTLEQMQQEMMSAMTSGSAGVNMDAVAQMQNLDQEQMTKDFMEVSEKLEQAFEAKKGETETGEFTVDGQTYTSRTPVNMTFGEFLELLLTSMKELLGKESMQPVLQMYGKDKDIVAEIEKALEELKNKPEEELPEMTLAIYTDGAVSYYTCDLDMKANAEGTAKAGNTHIGFGEAEGKVKAQINFEQEQQTGEIGIVLDEAQNMDVTAVIHSAQGDATITAAKDAAGNLDLVADIISGGTKAKLIAKGGPLEDERTGFSMEMYMEGSEEPLLAVTGTAGKGGEIVSAFEGEKITVLPIEGMLSGTDKTSESKLQMTMVANLMKTILVVAKNLPADSAAWLTQQIKQMMSTQTALPKSN